WKAWDHGKGMARDGNLAAILPRQSLNLHLGDASEAQTSPFSFGTILDLNRLDAQDFANERGKTRQMSPCLSGKDLGQSVLLILICSLVQIQSDFPFNLHHVTGRLGSKHGVMAVELDLPKTVLIDVPSQQDGAFSAGRRAEKNTRTGNFTITGFKIGSGN